MLHVGEVIAQRYRVLSDPLRGGQGEVYRCEDGLLGGLVALKLLREEGAQDLARQARERRALQLLRLPGVVELRDQGVHQGLPFLAMAWAEGAPFPGPLADGWSEEGLLSPLTGLLEALAGVHAAGIVHRDLKPDNVLVSECGGVILLDFGLARGRRLGGRTTETGDVLGTTDYLAPELLIAAAEPSPSADVFAVGVMAWGALTQGAHPWPAASLGARIDAYARGDAPRWRDLCEVPPAAQAWLERALHLDPLARFPSAGHALDALVGRREEPLPWLGSREVILEAVAALREGRSVALGVDPGLGRTRLIAEIAEILQAEGRSTVAVCPGELPLESLRPLGLNLDPEGGRDDAVREARRAVERRSQAGDVILVDHPERVDPSSLAVLEGHTRRGGGVLRVVRPGDPGALLPTPLREADLHALFLGPERLLHRPSRGAAQLWRSAGGHPRRIAAELSAWRSLGIVTREEDRFLLHEAGLDRLEMGLERPLATGRPAGLSRPLHGSLQDLAAWIALATPGCAMSALAAALGLPLWQLELQVESLVALGLVEAGKPGHVRDRSGGAALAAWPPSRRQQAAATLGRLLPAGERSRLRLLLDAELVEEACDEIGAQVAPLLVGGRLAVATPLIELGLDLARELDDATRERALLRALALVALAREGADALRHAHYEVSRALSPWPTLATLIEASLLAQDGSSAEAALAALDALAPFDDEELEAWRWSGRAQAASRVSGAAHAARVEGLWAWSRGRGPVAAAKGAALMAHRCYREGAVDQAIRLHQEALALRMQEDARVATTLALSSALLEVGRWAEAEQGARDALARAATIRHRPYEARAEWLLRRVLYQSGQEPAPDLELVEASDALGLPYLAGLIALTEAAIAWRAAHPEARRLAERAAELLTLHRVLEAELLARALAARLCEDRAAAAVALVAARAMPLPGIRLQAMAIVSPVIALTADDVVQAEADAETLRSGARRREILSVEECSQEIARSTSHLAFSPDGVVETPSTHPVE